jgi:hypothetical protein
VCLCFNLLPCCMFSKFIKILTFITWLIRGKKGGSGYHNCQVMKNIKLAGLKIYSTATHMQDRCAELRYSYRYTEPQRQCSTHSDLSPKRMWEASLYLGKTAPGTNIYWMQYDAEGRN